MWAVISFLMFTGMVAVISYWKTRNEDLGHSTGYFLAGRSLTWVVGAAIRPAVIEDSSHAQKLLQSLGASSAQTALIAFLVD